MKQITAAQRSHMLLNDPVRSVIPRLAIPTIISMLITSIYNLADTYFVSQLGTSASGAVGIVFSAMGILQACAFTIGMGSGTNLSRALGSGNREEANVFVSLAFFTTFITGTILLILGITLLDPLVHFLGATETIAPYARDYAFWIFLAAPFLMSSLAMNNLLRFQGMALYAMLGIGTGGLLNMALDPLLIFGLNLGIKGAAIATAISQIISFSILLTITNTRKDTIHITPKHFKPTRSLYIRILSNGFPSLGRQGIACVATIVLNNTAAAWGDPAIAAMSIVSRFVMFINSTIVGFGQGFQPVCGFSFGAKKYSRVREAYSFCVRVASIIMTVLAFVSFFFARPIVTAFRPDDAEVIAIGTLALQLQLCTLPLWGLIVMSSMLTQSIGDGMRSTIISISRQGLFLIPLLFILPPVFGLTGLQAAQPVGDVFAFGLAILLVRNLMRKLKKATDGEPLQL